MKTWEIYYLLSESLFFIKLDYKSLLMRNQGCWSQPCCMQRRMSLSSRPLLRLLIGLYQNVKERKSWMCSSLTTSSILIPETQQSTCWAEEYVPGGSLLLKTIVEYSFALRCSCGFSESWLWSDFRASFPFLWFFCRDSAQNPLLSLFYSTSLCLFKILKNTY